MTTDRRDEGMAMFAVLVALVLILPLALAALDVVVQSQKDVTYERSRTRTVHAAEAGLDAATAALRAASNGGIGVRAALPCAGTSPIVGGVGAQEPGQQYSVTLRYY